MYFSKFKIKYIKAKRNTSIKVRKGLLDNGINQRLNLGNLLKKKLTILERELSQPFDVLSRKRKTSKDIVLLTQLKSYRGTRHKRHLPCRGQRTHTNGKTCKKYKKVYARMRKKKAKK